MSVTKNSSKKRKGPPPVLRSCSVSELISILTEPSNGLMMCPSQPFNEVWPGILIGDGETAKNLARLRSIKVTHIVNVAQGKSFGHVNTNQLYYEKEKIQFLGIQATDLPSFNLKQHFALVVTFIRTAVKEENGKVLVHCREGFSRSATFVIAYLMMEEDMSVQEAVKRVRAKREIGPNEGFLRQLGQLNDELVETKEVAESVSQLKVQE